MSAPVAVLGAAAAELLLAPVGARGVEAFGVVLSTALVLLWQPLLVLAVALAVSVLFHLVERAPMKPAWLSLGGITATGLSYHHLLGYERFAGYVPFLAAWALCAAYLAWSHHRLFGTLRLWHRGALMAIGLVAGGACLVLAGQNLDSRYPTFLTSLFQVRFLALHAAAALALSLVVWTWRRALWTGGSAVAVLFVLAFAGGNLDVHDRARALVRESTSVGIADATRRSVLEACEVAPEGVDTNTALALFDEHSHLPSLPADFRLDDYNVLLITVEALRTDHTAIGGAPLTPNLQSLVDRGAHSFARAYSASSRTWLSLAALFSMAPPSLAPIVTHSPGWMGTLLSEATTVAEIFAERGYTTRALRHDFQGTRGLEQGFDEVYLEPGRVAPRAGVDRNLAGRTIDSLATLAGQKFFVWTFFASPHDPYLGDDTSDVPTRYRNAVMHFDAQLGRVLRYLERTELLDRTVVIVTADHGEEISDNRGIHGISLRSESIQVPLVVWIPGMAGTRHERPVSLVHLFPWLFRSAASAPMRGAGERAMQYLGAVLRDSGGAAIAEIVDDTTEQVSLVWAQAKLDYNYRSELTRVFSYAEGALDAVDRATQTHRVEVREALEHWQRFRRTRACLRRVQVLAEPVPVTMKVGDWQEYHAEHELP